MHAMYVALNEVQGCMVHTECAEMTAVSSGTSHAGTKQRCKHTTWVDIQSGLCEAKVAHIESHAARVQ